jgi:hypothetical protein
MFFEAYGTKFQIPLFTGFLTLSGFLLSLTTFIVVRMHDSVYTDEFYQKRVETFKRIDATYTATKPLKQLSNFLAFCVVMTLLASFLQFTLGNLSYKVGMIVCISVAAGAGVSVISAGVLIKRNIAMWMEYLDSKTMTTGATE